MASISSIACSPEETGPVHHLNKTSSPNETKEEPSIRITNHNKNPMQAFTSFTLGRLEFSNNHWYLLGSQSSNGKPKKTTVNKFTKRITYMQTNSVNQSERQHDLLQNDY
jgi:hypothetical protein